MPPPIAGFARCTIVGRFQGQQVENTFVYKAQTLPDFTDVTVFHAAAALYWQVTILPAIATNLSDTFVFTEFWSQIWTPTQIYVKQVTGSAIGGGLGDPPLPAEVAFVTTKLTPFAGKKNRGRCYWTGLTAQQMNTVTGLWDAVLTASIPGQFQLACKHAITTVAPARVWDPCVTDSGLQRYALLSDGGWNTAPRAQRRRQIGRGI